jgi:hypothetical protein
VKYLIVGLLAGAALAAPGRQTFTGVITDDMCAGTGHAAMRMGPTDGECTVACVQAHGASYVLLAGKTIYNLSNQELPEKFAGAKVSVIGTLDVKTKTINVESIRLR